MPTTQDTLPDAGKQISRLSGQFSDRTAEDRFFFTDIQNTLRWIRIMVLSMGFLYLVFLIPDLLLLSQSWIKWVVIGNRLFYSAYTVFLYVHLKKISTTGPYVFWITLSEALAVGSFLLVFIIYEPADFLIQSFGLMVILSVFFLIPNQFASLIGVCLLSIGGFLATALVLLPGLNSMHVAAATVYLLLVVLTGSLSFRRAARLKRLQYLDNQRLQELLVTDPLTQCYNRLRFDEALVNEIAHAHHHQVPLSLILIDYDHFKKINDQFSHLTGDQVLIQTSRSMRKIIQIQDTLARWGGEEFIILLPDTRSSQAVELAERLRQVVQKCDIAPDVKVSCSFGVTQLRSDDTEKSLLQRLDKALYKAKTNGRNQVTVI